MRNKQFLPTFPLVAPTVVTSGAELVGLVQSLTNWFFVGFLLTAVVFLIIAAFQFLTGGGDPQAVDSAKKKLIWGAVAVIIAVLARSIPLVVENIITANPSAGGAPIVTTNPATLVTSTTATLNSTINPNGSATTVWFRYGTSSINCSTDTGGLRIPATGGLPAGSGTTNFAVGQGITGLSPGTTYLFCARATNSSGPTGSSAQFFTTP